MGPSGDGRGLAGAGFLMAPRAGGAVRGKPHGAPEGSFSVAGPIVRIHLPQAKSRSKPFWDGIYYLEPIWLNFLIEKLGLDLSASSPFLHLSAAAGELVVVYGTQELPE